MDKTVNIIRYVAIGSGYLIALFFFLPLYADADQAFVGVQIILGFGVANFDIFSFLTFLLPAIGSTLLLLKLKYSESIATLLFLLAGFALIMLPDFAGFVNGDLALSLIKTSHVASIMFSFMAALLALILANAKHAFTTYQIVEMAMLVSLAVVFDLPGLKIRIGAAGGSIGLTMVPLLILALRQGPIKGFIGCGIVYGFATCVLDGWGLVYYPFDYLLGYGSLALLGIFSPLIFNPNITKFNVKGMLFLILGIFISIVGRLLAATLSGIIYYQYTFWASLLYNISYILPSAGIVLVVLVALYDPLIRADRLLNQRLES
ncbi:MAG: energy-coupled thiamine transporter ThiT [Bacilli bacterium]|jgi:thiamine transporter